MSKITFTENAWDDYLSWQNKDKKTIKKINALIKDIARSGREGIGKSERLRHRDGWSRRIDDANRLVYRVGESSIEIVQCKGHYDD